jgi:hypothetical protein
MLARGARPACLRSRGQATIPGSLCARRAAPRRRVVGVRAAKAPEDGDKQAKCADRVAYGAWTRLPRPRRREGRRRGRAPPRSARAPPAARRPRVRTRPPAPPGQAAALARMPRPLSAPRAAAGPHGPRPRRASRTGGPPGWRDAAHTRRGRAPAMQRSAPPARRPRRPTLPSYLAPPRFQDLVAKQLETLKEAGMTAQQARATLKVRPAAGRRGRGDASAAGARLVASGPRLPPLLVLPTPRAAALPPPPPPPQTWAEMGAKNEQELRELLARRSRKTVGTLSLQVRALGAAAAGSPQHRGAAATAHNAGPCQAPTHPTAPPLPKQTPSLASTWCAPWGPLSSAPTWGRWISPASSPSSCWRTSEVGRGGWRWHC